jgi:hypothetical protein
VACRATESGAAAPKRCPGLLGGGAGALSLGWWSVGLDRPSQFRHCWFTRTLQKVALFLDNDLHFLDSRLCGFVLWIILEEE